jgi:hypothetical protein
MDLLWAVAVIFVVMWAMGFAFHFTMGGLIHLLLVLAIISVLARIITGRHRTA